MARAVLPRFPHQSDLRRDERDPAHRHRARRPQAGGLLNGAAARRRTAALVLLAAALSAAACSEEDRRAWVSILPISQNGDEGGGEGAGPIALSPDSTAVIAGRDTLFSIARVPEEAGGRAARIASASFAPDSTAIALRLVGPVPSVVVWPRLRQAARVVRTFPGGEVMTVDWSPGGRLLAFQGRDADGGTQAGIYDVEVGLVGRHAALRWLERRGQSVRFQAWVGPGRARFLVGPEEGGLAYVWDVPSGIFVLESHMAALASQPPPGAPQRSGVFSLDLGGDPTPETVALFRTRDGAPGAYVLVDAGPGGVRGTATAPLVPADAVGGADWKDTARGADLYEIAEIGGRPALLLTLPSESRFLAIGFFQLAPGGTLEPITLAGPAGAGPAIFPQGVVGDETRRLGLADLDGDGAEEVISATGRREAGVIRWSAEVFRWDGARLAAAPLLEPAALEQLERLAGGQ